MYIAGDEEVAILPASRPFLVAGHDKQPTAACGRANPGITRGSNKALQRANRLTPKMVNTYLDKTPIRSTMVTNAHRYVCFRVCYPMGVSPLVLSGVPAGRFLFPLSDQ